MSDEPPQTKAKKEKPTGPPLNIEKRPQLSKAERRELQETQRAAKTAAGASGGGGGGCGGGKPKQQNDKSQQKPSPSVNDTKGGNKNPNSNANVDNSTNSTSSKSTNSSNNNNNHNGGGSENNNDDTVLKLFSHLPQHKTKTPAQCGVTLAGNSAQTSAFTSSSASTATSTSNTTSNANKKDKKEKDKEGHLHEAILEVGLQYANGNVRGANKRCVAMLYAFMKVVQDYTTPANKVLAFDLVRTIRPQFQHLTLCRPHSISMGNAFAFLKVVISSVPVEMPEAEAKGFICDEIQRFVQEKIVFAGEVIAEHACTKIHDGDVLLTYAKSSVIEILLKKAKLQGKKFRVIVVDSRPLMEGRELLERLNEADIKCTYILLTSLSYVMPEVTLVLLGAGALLSNGGVLSRVGTATVAMMAASYNVPTLFCAETYKLSNRVQLDSVTMNELGDPDDIAHLNPYNTNDTDGVLSNWKDLKNLNLLNLRYDVCPIDFVGGVVTEVGILPPTSVAVLLREMNGEW